MTIKSTYQAVEIIEELDGKYHNATVDNAAEELGYA